MPAEVLTTAQMYRADSLAMAQGVSGERLMEAAGFAVAREVRRRFAPCRVAVLCGPGNNGGDGFVAARLLERQGYAVRLALLGEVSALKGDAAIMAARWPGRVEPLAADVLHRADVVVDALFGAGLSRPLDGVAAQVLSQARNIIAVDVPSGVHGDTGAVLGYAPQALATVTFFRKKPAHLLLPGRELCGEVVVADIGIPAAVLDDIAPTIAENSPALWRYPWPRVDGHKYSRGHAVVVGGAAMTGAARLAAVAARRAGAGLVTIAAPAEAVPVYGAAEPGTLVSALDDFPALLADSRKNAFVLGPGGGGGEGMRFLVHAALAAGKACVLDADALTCFAGQAEALFAALAGAREAVLTPHDGEFSRLFGSLPGSRLERARAAAARCGAVVLLKGPDTVIAHPDGRAVINAHASPWLATAGSGDVLAGLMGGLMAAGMDAFSAACAAAWLHGEAARAFGPGLMAEDLPDMLPRALARLAVELGKE